MSKEYIEREKVIEVIKNYGKNAVDMGQSSLDPVDDIILLQGAVKVVRCKDCGNIRLTRSEHKVCIKQAKAEAYKEFAERLKKKKLHVEDEGLIFKMVHCYEIDNLLKELVGGDNV